MSKKVAPPTGNGTDAALLDVRPERSRRWAIIAAVVVLAIHILFAALLTIHNTGANQGVRDQFGLAFIGVIIAGLILLLARPRLTADATGVHVRNFLGYRDLSWHEVVRIWYPDKGYCARIELAADEYLSVFAIQANDGELAVAAMDRFRELHETAAQ